jgi:toxin ParE1/3/4
VTKKYRVDTNPAAEEDIRFIYQRIATDNPVAASRWLVQIERLIARLETFPQAFELIPEASEIGADYRHKFFGNYRIIYRITGDRVIIVRVIHGARLLLPSMFGP